MQDIFETIEDQGTTYDDAVTKLSAYFEPKKKIHTNVTFFTKVSSQQMKQSTTTLLGCQN